MCSCGSNSSLKIRIDTWDNENMYVLIDGFLWQAKWGVNEGSDLCGNGRKQAFFNVEIIAPHNNPTVSVVLTSNLDEDALNEAWGFRDFKLSFLRCPGECSVCTENNPSKCFFWHSIATNWYKDISIEGWTLTGEGKAEKNDCSGV